MIGVLDFHVFAELINRGEHKDCHQDLVQDANFFYGHFFVQGVCSD